MNRRTLLKAFGLLSCASPFGIFTDAASATPGTILDNRKRGLRIAHVTDMIFI